MIENKIQWISPLMENLNGNVIIQGGTSMSPSAESTTFNYNQMPLTPGALAAAGAAACAGATTGTAMIYPSSCVQTTSYSSGPWGPADGNFVAAPAGTCIGAVGAPGGALVPFSCS